MLHDSVWHYVANTIKATLHQMHCLYHPYLLHSYFWACEEGIQRTPVPARCWSTTGCLQFFY